MKPIIIKSNKFLDSISWFFKVGGITLYPFIIVRPYAKKSTINHESIHIAQYTELLIIGFLLIYLYDWIHDTNLCVGFTFRPSRIGPVDFDIYIV